MPGVASAGAAAADAPDPGAELAAQVAGAAAQLTAELGRLAKSAAPPPAPGSASFSAVGVLDAAARQQASMDTRSYSASSPDTRYGTPYLYHTPDSLLSVCKSTHQTFRAA